ncbi:uncharacterized protein LOC123553206 [Mercenaria mercenaria]|uniref:uncharacterized protein LOC123553206 n=1 Tax=Mercenaria mercenaria TaxID=6596 RepID=UPI001E1DBE88|nr:uncharacterized protein LOC123553206 [Mercenaria mercenaria]
MDFSSKVFLCVFLADSFAILCLGQLENMGMLALAGGLGGRGMGTGSMGMGGGTYSAALGLAAAGMTPAQYAVLDNTVKSVVGPHASPDLALITYAKHQGAAPRNAFQFMGYMPFFQNIARTVGVQPSTGSGQTGTGTNQAQNTDAIVMQKAVQWMQRNGFMMPLVAPLF